MKRLSIGLLLALVAISSVAGFGVAWAGRDDTTGPDSIQAP